MAENALPNPTRKRLKLAEAIAAGKVRHYPFYKPETYNDIHGGVVTSDVRLFESFRLVEVPEPAPEYNYAIVRLTPAGEEWSGFTNRTEGEGPGSTSPEPGPPPVCPFHGEHPHADTRCADCPECKQ